MNEQFIKRAAMSNRYFAEEIEYGYVIPTHIFKNTRKEERIEISSSRRSALMNNGSSFSRNFEKDLEKLKGESQGINEKYFQYIKEFPVPLDKIIWENLIRSEGVEEGERDKLWNKNYILLDYFFPKSGIIVEIDSDFHKDKIIDDRVRDNYLYRKYGLDTIRFYNYGENIISSVNSYKSLKKEFVSRVSSLYQCGIYNNTIMDFSDLITETFIIENKEALSFIQKLFRYTGREGKRGIVVTMRDVYNIDPYNFGIFTGQMQSQEFLDNIEMTLKYVFNVKLKIHNSMQYTVEDVMWAVNNKDNPGKWDIVGDEVPYWLGSIFGNPGTKDLKNRKICGNRDDNVCDLVANLRFYKYFDV